MNREDVIRMAREAELIMETDCTTPWVEDHDLTPYLERFAALVAAEERAEMAKHCAEITRAAVTKAVDGAIALEREACAKVCEDEAEKQFDNMDIPLTIAADLIRARKENT